MRGLDEVYDRTTIWHFGRACMGGVWRYGMTTVVLASWSRSHTMLDFIRIWWKNTTYLT